MKRKIVNFIIIVMFTAFITFIKQDVFAESKTLITVNGKSITSTTTPSQLSSMFGTPKQITDSAFGGKAYSYCDSEYTWFVHVETDASGLIKGYGAINGEFSAQKYSFSDTYSYTLSVLSGSVIYDYDTSKVYGVYEYNCTYDEATNFWTKFSENSSYLYNLQKHSLIASKVLANKHGYNFPQTYINEELFYINEQLKYNDTDLYNYGKNNGKSKYIKLISSRTDTFYSELPNPIALGKTTEHYEGAENYQYIFYDIDVMSMSPVKLYTTVMFVDPSFMEEKESVDLNGNELNLLEAAKEQYELYVKHGEAIENNFDVTPVYDSLPLTAGKWSDMALNMATDYLNIARAGLGIKTLTLDSEIADCAQHKAALVYYLNSHGYSVSHVFDKPDEIEQEFYDKAQSYMNENLYYGNIQVSIINALNDAYGDPVTCGHRYNLLEPSYTKWGVGSVGSGISYGWQGVHKFAGYESFSNELVAWPSNGIFPMDMASSGIGNWTAKFYKNYKVSSDTEVTIKCLNSGKTYEITNENKNQDGKYLKASSSQLLTFRDDSIAYEAGDVFEITLHNVTDSSGNVVDYKYRSVFYSFYQLSDIPVTSISLSETNLEMPVGQTIRIFAKVYPEDATNKIIKFVSSDENVATVRQDGTISSNSKGTATITVSTANGKTAICKVNVVDVIKGDINRDSRVNINDVNYALRGFTKGTLTEEEKQIGDVNLDGIFNINDINQMLRNLVGKK